MTRPPKYSARKTCINKILQAEILKKIRAQEGKKNPADNWASKNFDASKIFHPPPHLRFFLMVRPLVPWFTSTRSGLRKQMTTQKERNMASCVTSILYGFHCNT